MDRLPRLDRGIGAAAYAAAAAAILLSQPLAVALAFLAMGRPLARDGEFWLLPLRKLAWLPDLPPWAAALAFAFSLLVAAALATVSFRRAARSGRGFALAALSIVPVVQIPAIAALALLPARTQAEPPPEAGVDVAAILQGVVAGMALIVFAVLVSAVLFRAYGWGLFVLTPFLVGLTTGYLANRRALLGGGRTTRLVLAAAGLGCLLLIAFALEGAVCIVLAAPLSGGAAILGGAFGRFAAILRGGGATPLMSCALLPAVLALDAALPPSVTLESREAIDIAAPPAEVWRALTSSERIGPEPGLVFRLGLAYPVRARLSGEGVGAERIGEFSTGFAHERITAWAPGRRLAFAVLSQPPTMTELSPYREVHAPHVRGYFETRSTRFDLLPRADGSTRLVMTASHLLRLDPVLYWEPVARWAIHQNTMRVLRHLRASAERR